MNLVPLNKLTGDVATVLHEHTTFIMFIQSVGYWTAIVRVCVCIEMFTGHCKIKKLNSIIIIIIINII